jgi:hypothetical protein
MTQKNAEMIAFAARGTDVTDDEHGAPGSATTQSDA